MTKSKAPKKRIYSKPGQADIELYPNQTTVTVHKTSDNYLEEGIPFCQFSIWCWNYASRILRRKSSLQLYTYLLMNKNNYQKAFSPQDIQNECGIAKRSFYEGRDELIEEGFLYLNKKDGKKLLYDAYDFYESPFDNPHWEFYEHENENDMYCANHALD